MCTKLDGVADLTGDVVRELDAIKDAKPEQCAPQLSRAMSGAVANIEATTAITTDLSSMIVKN